MITSPIARVMEHRRRRVGPAERPVVAHIDPGSTGHRLPFGQNRHRRVVAVHAAAGKDMGADQIVERAQQRGAAADLIGERREAEIDAFPPVPFRLPIERLVLSVLLEQHHCEKARAGEAARQHMERRRGLADRLARPACELLPDVLQHLPLPRHDLQRLGDVLAELGKPGRPAAGAGARAGNDDPLARQILREGFARWLLAGERANRGTRCWRSPFASELILRRGRFEFLQFELHLVEKARAPFAALAVSRAPHHLDGEPQMRDHRVGVGFASSRMNQVSARDGEIGMGFCKLHFACQQ